MASKLAPRLALAFLGGCAGGALRILIDVVWETGNGVPWDLLAINLIGSFAIGVIGVLWGGHHGWWPLLGPGLLGGFTTFSAIAALTWSTTASLGVGLAVLAASLVVCTLAARAGVAAGTRAKGRA